MNEILSAEEVKEMLDARMGIPLREALARMEGADIAALMADLDDKDLLKVYRLLQKEQAAQAFAEMTADLQKKLIDGFTDKELRTVLDEMYFDDTVDLIDEMPASVANRILANSSPADRKQINELLKYSSDSAGGLMTTEYVLLKSDMTVEQAFDRIRRDAYDKESVYTCYVTDATRHLVGVLDVKTLLLAQAGKTVGELMNTDVIYVQTDTDRETVAREFEKYNFTVIPVTDAEKRLVGIITVDDAVDVILEEAEEDFAKMAAVTPSELPYLRTGVFTVFKNRFPWLLLMMLTATFTSLIISGFENALSVCVVLTAFIPMLMGSGGNSGAQSSVTVIRGLSLGEIEVRDVVRVLWHELRVSLLCSVALSAVAFLKIISIDRLIMGPEVTASVALTVSLTLCVTVIFAKLIGAVLPLAAKKCKLDPAVMASPFITTVVDALSLLVYFLVAKAVLGI